MIKEWKEKIKSLRQLLFDDRDELYVMGDWEDPGNESSCRNNLS